MRIGTWNLEGRWDDRHLARVVDMACDVYLLTEVSERVEIPGFQLHSTTLSMAPRRRWAAVATRGLSDALADPHGASAMVEFDGLRICASILPWRSCGTRSPWVGSTTAEKTETSVADVLASAPTVWGGDWNHALAGREWSSSINGRSAILEALGQLQLQVPTVNLPHQIPGLLTIDHIAVPTSWTVHAVEHHRAFVGDVRISDHDAYLLEVEQL